MMILHKSSRGVLAGVRPEASIDTLQQKSRRASLDMWATSFGHMMLKVENSLCS